MRPADAVDRLHGGNGGIERQVLVQEPPQLRERDDGGGLPVQVDHLQAGLPLTS